MNRQIVSSSRSVRYSLKWTPKHVVKCKIGVLFATRRQRSVTNVFVNDYMLSGSSWS